MNVAVAIALRVLTQLRRDPRTIALLLLVPVLLVTIVRYLFDGQPETFDRVGLPLVGIFPLVSMFLVTSIAMLRERVSGTLERLMTMPTSKPGILFGYALAFAAVAAVQAALVAGVAVVALDLDVRGSFGLVVLLAVMNALFGMALGLFVSAFARTEFQVVQFMPAFLLPQILLCGLFVPRERMLGVFEAISDALPMTYAFDGLQRVASSSGFSAGLATDVGVIVGSSVIALLLGAGTLRRRTP
jgi:ABC-2 type transport system permease protein